MRTVSATLLTALLAACGAPVTGTATSRGVPGFDTRDYPGDATMSRWYEASPYRWVGYYLPAPCYTGTTWTGRRDALRAIGWGFAVIYVGEQDWRAIRPAAADTLAVAVENPRCTAANLTAERGREHAAAASAAAAADGFPTGTIIFLDVERVDRVAAELLEYVRAWTGALLDEARYVPGLYAHDVNTAALYAAVAEEFVRRQRTDAPLLWVAHAANFDIASAPTESGYPVAAIWQGRFNTRESWAGTTLNIDVNVATSADPSRGR